MKRLLQAGMVWLLVAGTMTASGAKSASYAEKISSLVDPAKLATLGTNAANPRVQKYVALLADAQAAGEKPKKVAARALELVGMEGEAAKLTAKTMVGNLKIAERYGCVDEEGLKKMHAGEPPTVRRGRDKGDKLSVDHVIPRSVAPELGNRIANLELMPLRENEKKNAHVGERQMELGRKLEKAGLLSPEGMRAIEKSEGRGRRTENLGNGGFEVGDLRF
jgi:hypothetical protein